MRALSGDWAGLPTQTLLLVESVVCTRTPSPGQNPTVYRRSERMGPARQEEERALRAGAKFTTKNPLAGAAVLSLMASSLMPKPLDARHLPCGAELPPVDLAGALADGQRDGLRRLDPSGAQLARVDLVHRGVRRADDRAQRAPGQGWG